MRVFGDSRHDQNTRLVPVRLTLFLWAIGRLRKELVDIACATFMLNGHGSNGLMKELLHVMNLTVAKLL